ncbi:hypothetical protein MESS4_340130 [Mesorhizobium sp. STM 4661]|nr:hypothetical protein MESS4_340130 [Mesorhizobium sp. STM 4661]
MPSPSAIAVCVRPLALRMRRMRGPAKIFWSAMVSLREFTRGVHFDLRFSLYNIYKFTAARSQTQHRFSFIFRSSPWFFWPILQCNVNDVTSDDATFP